MAHRFKSDLSWDDVTPKEAFFNRRAFLAGATALAAGGIGGAVQAAGFSTDEEPNSWEEITTYNNFYEFGTGKDDPAKYADALTTSPWSIEIDGIVEKPGTYSFDDITKEMTIEERIYRFRCVEAWSMVI
ncbi:MAG: mononuclear molybdenum enzyme YedY, partial [Litoreibacter sp.]|nr:mononuclear molybdenum enzyme YedY [Litoreibacter sp.]